MFRTDIEINVGRSLFVDGMTQQEAAAACAVSQQRVSQIRTMIVDSLDMLGVNIKNPVDVSDAVRAIIRRAEQRRQTAA